MKLMIAGSRSITEFDLTPYIPADTELIISGGAIGVDTIAEHYADEHRISKLIVYPRYEQFGRSAPIRRNEQMVNFADRVLVIWDGKSRGSAHTINYAKKKEKPLQIINVK